MWSRRSELFASLFLIGFGIFLIALDLYKNLDFSSESTRPLKSFVPDLLSSKEKNISQSSPDNFTKPFTTKKEKSFLSALISYGLDKKSSQQISTLLRTLFKTSVTKKGDLFCLNYIKNLNDPSLTLQKIIYISASGKKVAFFRSEEEDTIFKLEYVPYTLSTKLFYFKGSIKKSIYSEALKVGMNQKNLGDLIQLLSYSLDLQRSVPAQSQFEVLIEKKYDEETGFLDRGTLIFSGLETPKIKLKFYRYDLKDSTADYFDEKGHGVKKALLQTPIKGGKINSGFGNRKHPILGFTRFHKGVDFKAPKGTPVWAAGDGFVRKIGYLGSYGNYVLLQHSGLYSTAYAHLSRYEKSLKKGAHVKQGQIIGYVGSTGRATGPHLHYEVLFKNGQINPKTLKMPSQKNLTGNTLKNFTAYRKIIDQKILFFKYR